MICPRCGCETTGNYCSNCGVQLTAEDTGFAPEECASAEPGMEYEYTESLRPAPEHFRPEPKRLRPEPDCAPSRPRASKKRAEDRSEVRSRKKEMKKKDARLKKMEGELGNLRSQAEESSKSLEHMEAERRESRKAERRESYEAERRTCRGGETVQAVKSTGAGAVVLISRVMQLASAVLMAAMTAVMLQSFWEHGQELGDIRYLVEERNYSLAIYVGFAGAALFMGLVWCLWILSRKGAGGGVRMKKYDIGRGFLPFLFCMAVIVAAGALLLKVPQDETVWRGSLKGLRAALEAVYVHRNGLFFCSAFGAVLSFVRKLLRV